MITRALRKAFEAEQCAQPLHLTPVPREAWPAAAMAQVSIIPAEVWRSRRYLVQIFPWPEGERITVNRAALQGDGDWSASITWDELQEIKRDVGRGHCWAVEVFPPDNEVVNVANMRHLWVLPAAPTYGWRRSP